VFVLFITQSLKKISHVDVLDFIVDFEVKGVVISDKCRLLEREVRFFIVGHCSFKFLIEDSPLLVVGRPLFSVLSDSIWLACT
jgi:hypothetical protein